MKGKELARGAHMAVTERGLRETSTGTHLTKAEVGDTSTIGMWSPALFD
jgi:hypothetical protein